jgi:hypothetical protein
MLYAMQMPPGPAPTMAKVGAGSCSDILLFNLQLKVVYAIRVTRVHAVGAKTKKVEVRNPKNIRVCVHARGQEFL